MTKECSKITVLVINCFTSKDLLFVGAQMILQRQPICIEGQYVDVSLYTDEPEKQCTIQVQGLPNIESHIDALRMYFKNTKRSGGGTIVHCEADKDNHAALITFETEEGN
jgi:hypothetical protein